MDGRPCPLVLFRRTFAYKKIFYQIFLKLTSGYWITYIKPMCQMKIHGGQKEMDNVHIRVRTSSNICIQFATRRHLQM